MVAPDDVSGIATLFEQGIVAPEHVRGVIAQTQGDSFARGYFTLALELLLSERLGVPRAEITEIIPIMVIGGTAGLMSPHATLFVRKPATDTKPVHEAALALGFAFTRTLEEGELGTAAQAVLVAEAVKAAMDDAGLESADDVAAVEMKCPQPSPESAPVVGAGELGAASRGACALGAAIALGEVDRNEISDSAIGARYDLYARRASASSGGELHNVRIVVVGNRRGAPGRQRAGWGVMADQLDVSGAISAFEMAGLGERRKQEGTTLSGGEQQMLAIGRTLARDVKLLLLDEPYEGLAPVIVQEIERTLEQIKALGMTTIIVEQNAIAALHLADRAIILDMGQVVFDGTVQEVLDNADLHQQYLAI